MKTRQEWLDDANCEVAKAIGRQSYFLGLTEAANGYPIGMEHACWAAGYQGARFDEHADRMKETTHA